MKTFLRCLLILFMAVGTAHGASLLTETFDDITTLSGAGWVQTNNSSPLGTTGWFQGNDGIFPAQAGAPYAYIAANFNNAALDEAGFGGNISNWLLTPNINLTNGDTIEFFTRTESPASFADRLEVRLSTNGASTNVGATDTSVGDFATLLLTINPALSPSGYPDVWTSFTATVSGLGAPTSGRFGFRYFVTDISVNGDYIGIDTVSVDSGTAPVPEPSILILLGMGLTAVAGMRRVVSRQ